MKTNFFLFFLFFTFFFIQTNYAQSVKGYSLGAAFPVGSDSIISTTLAGINGKLSIAQDDQNIISALTFECASDFNLDDYEEFKRIVSKYYHLNMEKCNVLEDGSYIFQDKQRSVLFSLTREQKGYSIVRPVFCLKSLKNNVLLSELKKRERDF